MLSPSAEAPSDIILLQAMWDKLKILAASPGILTVTVPFHQHSVLYR